MQLTNAAQIDTAFDYIGLVFPVCLFGVPELIENLIEKLPHCDKRIFVIVIYKSQTGSVLGQVQKLLPINKNVLYAGYTIAMPGNNIIYYELESEEMRTKNCFMPVREWGLDLPCGAGRVAALTCHRHVIHFRSRSSP